MFRLEKSIFLKLYRYYLKRLFLTGLLLLALTIFFVFSNPEIWGFLKNGIGEMDNIWHKSGLISLAKAFSLIFGVVVSFILWLIKPK